MEVQCPAATFPSLRFFFNDNFTGFGVAACSCSCGLTGCVIFGRGNDVNDLHTVTYPLKDFNVGNYQQCVTVISREIHQQVHLWKAEEQPFFSETFALNKVYAHVVWESRRRMYQYDIINELPLVLPQHNTTGWQSPKIHHQIWRIWYIMDLPLYLVYMSGRDHGQKRIAFLEFSVGKSSLHLQWFGMPCLRTALGNSSDSQVSALFPCEVPQRLASGESRLPPLQGGFGKATSGRTARDWRATCAPSVALPPSRFGGCYADMCTSK